MWRRRALLVALALAGGGPRTSAEAPVAAAVRGVAPEEQLRYSGGGDVACLVGGVAATISADRVNDDYCDCDGGEDEPATAACSHVLSSTFFCRNGGFFPQKISTSRVNDGVCDCCDGSDEGERAACTDTCATDAEAFRQKALETLARTQRGFQQRQRAVDGAVREYFDDASQAALAAAQTLQALEELKTRVAELKVREERKEAALRLAHARREQTQSAESGENHQADGGSGAEAKSACVPDEASGSTCTAQVSDQTSDSELSDDTEEFTEMDAHDFVDEDGAVAADTSAPLSEEGSEVQRVKAQVELSDGTRVSLSEYLRLENERRSKKQISAKRFVGDDALCGCELPSSSSCRVFVSRHTGRWRRRRPTRCASTTSSARCSTATPPAASASASTLSARSACSSRQSADSWSSRCSFRARSGTSS